MPEKINQGVEVSGAHPYRSVWLYDRALSTFKPWQAARVVTIDTPERLGVLESGGEVFADLKLYDIGSTMLRALRLLSARFPGCFVTVFGAPKDLIVCTQAGLDARLIADTTLVPSEIASSEHEAWKRRYGALALKAGCDGLLVNFDCSALAAQYPDKHFLMTQDSLG